MKTSALMMICGWLMTASASLQAGVLNVRDLGAVADDKTDNTAAFAKCMYAIIAAGGGKMFIPEGVYRGRIVTGIQWPLLLLKAMIARCFSRRTEP